MEQILFLVTVGIVVIVFALLVFFIFDDKSINKRYRKKSERINNVVEAVVKSKQGEAPLADNYFVEAQELFITKNINDAVVFSTKFGKLILKQPINQALPESKGSPYRFVPALLTTIGILGTFAGITLGLTSLDPSGGQSSTHLLSSAQVLLGGMKTAFITSLVGMLASLIFMMQLGIGAINNEKARKKAIKSLRKSSVYVQANELLHGLSNEGQKELVEMQIRAAKEAMSTQEMVQSSIEDLSKSLTGLNAESMAKAVGQSVYVATEKVMKPTLTDIAEELKVLHEIKKENSREVMEVMIAAMKDDIVEPLSAEIKRVIDSVDRSNQVSSKLGEKMGGVAEQLSSTSVVLSKFQEETMDKLQAFAGSLSSILDEFKTNSTQVLRDIATEIESSMTAAKEGLTQQRTVFNESAEKVVGMFSSQNKQLESVGEQAKDLMENASKNLTDGLSDMDSKIRSMSDVVQKELEAFRVEYQSNLEQFFTTQSNLLEDTLGQQREGLSKVVIDFRQVFVDEQEQRLQQRAELESGEKILRELNEAIETTRSGTFSQLDELATTVGKQVGLLRKSYEEASGRYATMIEEMPRAMGEWFKTAKGTQEDFFTSFDQAAADVHSRLADIAEMLLMSATKPQEPLESPQITSIRGD